MFIKTSQITVFQTFTAIYWNGKGFKGSILLNRTGWKAELREDVHLHSGDTNPFQLDRVGLDELFYCKHLGEDGWRTGERSRGTRPHQSAFREVLANFPKQRVSEP